MSTYSLTIRTLGICTHFAHGVVSGVPHRIVLPDATKIITGAVTVRNDTPVLNAPPVSYYLVPHFAYLDAAEADLNVHGLIRNGVIENGVRVQVINALDRAMRYEDDATPKLTQYEPGYTFSSDVVLHGRAACYFDVYGGTVAWVPPITKSGAGTVTITMETDGPPELLVTPLSPSAGPSAQSYRVRLAQAGEPREVTLSVKNLELAQERGAAELNGEFDYLLHYLTARGGIPQTIRTTTPGMSINPKSVTPARLAQALQELARLLTIAADPARRPAPMNEMDLTPSCSPSQYP